MLSSADFLAQLKNLVTDIQARRSDMRKQVIYTALTPSVSSTFLKEVLESDQRGEFVMLDQVANKAQEIFRNVISSQKHLVLCCHSVVCCCP